jgi:tetratricopeptide (TPR) repeat protein
MEVLSFKSIFRHFFLSLLILFVSGFVFSQETPTGGDAPLEEGVLPSVGTKINPVFPETEEGLIYIEGESAVSTNFAAAPVYNYGASAYKSLQLIQQNAPYGGQAYFAEYAFYVEDEGDYDFWYGGTPPGPSDSVFPSYASPFRYVLDGADPVQVYREDLAVNVAYTPTYYWMSVETIHLSEGVHRIRFEVPEKRRFDGQYYFFLDAFFFLRQDRMEDELVLVPPVFPKNRTDRSLNKPFQSISFYEKTIQENPGNKDAYIVLSMIYSLLGDYINAIKNLNKAASLDPKDPYILLLTAKNRIWNGEVSEGLTMYRQLLTLAPDNVSYWTEAGKVAAWTGKYRDSIEFFSQGLKQFPDDLNLKVNLGLTYLWMSRQDDAETLFKEAADSTIGMHDRAMELGSIHKVNGYPQYAVNIYTKELIESPEYLETYLSLEESYRVLGETNKADEIIKRVYDSFEESPALSTYMNVYEEKKSMKDGILQDYINALVEQPDNIPLRQQLSQTYFWNGLKEEAVDHSMRILINKLYISMKEFDTKASDLLSLIDRTSRYQELFLQAEEAYLTGSKDLAAAKSNYDKALAGAAKKPEDTALSEKVELATQAYVEVFDLYSLWSYRMAGLGADKIALQEEWADLLATETAEEDVFRQLLGESKWSWDRLFNLNELRQVQRSEPFLAGYVLSRLALFGGKPVEAGRYLESDVFDQDSSSRYGLYQSQLWSLNTEKQKEMWAQEADTLTLYRQHLFDMEVRVWKDESRSGFMIPLSEETEALINELSSRSREMKAEKDENYRLLAEMRQALDQKLVRQIYYYEQETYLLRYSLGEYYLDMDKNLKATRQFERVLAMDPWNISANYKLGIVSQRYGDWSRAMSQYKKVYYQNPRYENASSYYNQLARENADFVSVSAQNITDPSRIKYLGNAHYQTNVNTWLGWGLNYNLTMDRKYRVFGEEIPNQYKLHSLEVNVPIAFPNWNLVVTPLAGMYMWNDLYGVMDDYDFGTSIVTPSDTMDTMNVKPLFGLNVGWKKDFLDTGVSYQNKLEEESLFSDRNLTRSHQMSAFGQTYFPLENYYDWGPATTRTYGKFELLNYVNGSSSQSFRGQMLQEGSIGYVVHRKPLVRLTANGTVNFENGSDKDVIDYYLPKGVLEAKGGLRGTVNFHNDDYSEALEISLFGAAGGYWTDIIKQEDESQSQLLKVEGMFSLYYVKETMTLFFLMSGNSSFDNADLRFWEFAATIGARISVPSLLTY